jgi:ketosteroid isomerase-like protein
MAGCGTAQTPTPSASTSTLSAPSPTPAPTVTPDTRAKDEADVRQAATSWGMLIKTKDLDGMLAYYTDDAWVNPQGEPIAKTADERRKVWTTYFATPGIVDTTGETTRVEVARSGDLAVEYGTYVESIRGRKAQSRTITEKYVTTWRKQADGSWKVIADIWNRDK